MQCFLSCVLWAVMCFEGCGVCTVTVALHVSVLCDCNCCVVVEVVCVSGCLRCAHHVRCVDCVVVLV